MSRKFEVVGKYINEDGITNIVLPVRKTTYSAGYDLAAADDVFIYPKHMQMVPTGIKADMNEGEYLDLRIRSGLSVKQQAVLVNGAGVIDKDYYNNPDNEGEIFVPIINMGFHPISIKKGDRVAQGIFTKYFTIEDDNADGERVGGFGSTGVAEAEIGVAVVEEAIQEAQQAFAPVKRGVKRGK